VISGDQKRDATNCKKVLKIVEAGTVETL